ncbi:hypothetical protein D3272_17995 [Lichenibacterium ramalinae]|uniref:Uncharacterized protein n=2 Tax=Lichenibacterium ramalinae TaxID=2316527 RepID=A0A4V1RIC9_9HYPH|nr:hypothetical protein D3272_17995 [Lichenibacterium ramalinae]
MDLTMNALSIRALVGAGVAAVAMAGLVSVASLPLLLAAVSAALVAGLGLVAFVAQSRRLNDAERLVYRPVYVRRHDIQRRVMSDFE